MSDIVIIFAHSDFLRSRVNKAMLQAVRGMFGVKIRDLYELYPDFYIDVKAEQKAIADAKMIVLQHPLHWYSCPSLMKEWMDSVLQQGWAYGENGTALKGKRLLSAISAGGPQESYHIKGYNNHSVETLLLPFAQTARLCGMEYKNPLLFFSSGSASDEQIKEHVQTYQSMLTETCCGA